MAAFREAFSTGPSSSSAPNLSIRGSAAPGAPSGRGLSSALQSAGISHNNSNRDGEAGMDLDGGSGGSGAGGGAGRPARPMGRRGAIRADPLSQVR